jgi:hypothetical protein
MPVILPSGFSLVRYEFNFPAGGGLSSVIVGHDFNAAATAQANVDQLVTNFEDTVWDQAEDSAIFLGATLISGGGEQAVGLSGEPGGGGGFSTVTPNVSFLVHKLTGQSGRSKRGRLFLPNFFIPDAQVTDAGVIDAGIVSGMQTELTAWLTTCEAGSIGLRLLHTEDAPDDTPDTITALAASSLVSTQRRRLRR